MDAEETQELLELIDIRIRPPVGGQPCNVIRVDDANHVTLGISQMTLSINHEECCLPPGWSARYSPEHQRVCFYHESGRMQWTHPSTS
ncbi:hypothetical protein THRCLA_21523 [Thraustotheca clavata]|uniref:WW domain-containing protein n=1 Tax=Thraustotheca clavata TaxID=74557 RepID=A0A1V9ZVI3_9STRA|nr:hypothetical protein THRCLA_21523 [Thraustotheca clavata]